MKQTVTRYMFRDAFSARPNNFSYEGLDALFDYLEDYEDSTGEEIELDPIGLCCEFTEYENLDEIKAEYGGYLKERKINTLDDLENYATIIRVKGERFIAHDF